MSENSTEFDYDTTGVKETEGFPDMPEGDYRLKCKNSKMSMTKKTPPRPMASVCFEVIDHPEYTGRLVWHNVTFVKADEKGAGMAKHFLKAMGVDFDGKIKIKTKDWENQEIDVTLKISDPYKGKTRNEIDTINTSDEEEQEEEL